MLNHRRLVASITSILVIVRVFVYGIHIIPSTVCTVPSSNVTIVPVITVTITYVTINTVRVTIVTIAIVTIAAIIGVNYRANHSQAQKKDHDSRKYQFEQRLITRTVSF